MTLSCKIGSMRLRPEWPWRARKYKTTPDESVQCWYLFLFPPPCHAALPLLIRPMMTIQEMFLKIIFILQNSIAPSSSHRRLSFHDEEDWSVSLTLHNRRLSILMFQHRSKIFPPIRIVLVDELAEYRLCGFALVFDRLAKSPAFQLNAHSSNCISEFSCSLFKLVTNIFNPWEILTHEWELSLCSWT